MLNTVSEHSELIEGINEQDCRLIAHNICVIGHMWVFRRWYLSLQISIREYTDIQTDFILNRLKLR